MSSNEKSIGMSCGLGLWDVLGVLFIALKLCGVIDWSWWWVLAPFWGVFAIFAAAFVVFFTTRLIIGGK